MGREMQGVEIKAHLRKEDIRRRIKIKAASVRIIDRRFIRQDD